MNQEQKAYYLKCSKVSKRNTQKVGADFRTGSCAFKTVVFKAPLSSEISGKTLNIVCGQKTFTRTILTLAGLRITS